MLWQLWQMDNPLTLLQLHGTKLLRNIDQNRASNKAFWSAHRTPAPNLLCPLAIPLLPLKPPSVQAQARPTQGHPIPIEVDAN